MIRAAIWTGIEEFHQSSSIQGFHYKMQWQGIGVKEQDNREQFPNLNKK